MKGILIEILINYYDICSNLDFMFKNLKIESLSCKFKTYLHDIIRNKINEKIEIHV